MCRSLGLLFLLGAIASRLFSQVDIVGFDAHFLAVVEADDAERPRVGGEAVWRFVIPQDLSLNQELERTEVTAQVGGVDKLQIFATQWVTHAPEPARATAFDLRYAFRRGRFSRSSGSRSLPTTGTVVELGRWYRSTRTSLGRGKRYLVLVPLDDLSAAPTVWSPEDYARYLTRQLMRQRSVVSAWEFVRPLIGMPLQSLLTPPERLEFIRFIEREWDELGAGRGEDLQLLLRGGVANLFDVSKMLRIAAGDRDVLDELLDLEGRLRQYGPTLKLAFAQAKDPVTKGLVGWILARPRGTRGRSLASDLIAPLHAMVESGEAVLPGPPEEQAEIKRNLDRLVAEKTPKPGLLTLALGAVAMGLVAFAARRGSSRILS